MAESDKNTLIKRKRIIWNIENFKQETSAKYEVANNNNVKSENFVFFLRGKRIEL